jgi:hypothetical protein
MKMRSRVIIGLVVTIVILSVDYGNSFGQTPGEQNSTVTQPATKRQGFFDYALGKINPRGNDYGASMASTRSAVVEDTIDDLYFWSNTVTLIFLCGLAAVVLLQWRATDKREVIAASLIAQLWNGRVSDRIELQRCTEQFNRLVEAHNADVEKKLSQKPGTSQQDAEATGSLTRGVRSLADSKGISPVEAEKIEASAPDATAASLQQDNLLLKRRVEALQNSEQNLKQRLNQTTTLLDQERRRNATLKGA